MRCSVYGNIRSSASRNEMNSACFWHALAARLRAVPDGSSFSMHLSSCRKLCFSRIAAAARHWEALAPIKATTTIAGCSVDSATLAKLSGSHGKCALMHGMPTHTDEWLLLLAAGGDMCTTREQGRWSQIL